MNPADLFVLQQQQLQLQQQMEMQNFAAMTMAAQQGMKEDDDEGEEEGGGGCDDDGQQEYETGYHQYMEGSDPENGALNEDYSSNSSSSFLLNQQQQMFNLVNAAAAHQMHHSKSSSSSSDLGSKISFKKIKPVKRPGLVLKTPIAYQGNVDPSVIPIQREGMGRLPHAYTNFLFSFYFYS